MFVAAHLRPLSKTKAKTIPYNLFFKEGRHAIFSIYAVKH
jgi:hypothetical protein